MLYISLYIYLYNPCKYMCMNRLMYEVSERAAVFNHLILVFYSSPWEITLIMKS